MKEIYKNKIGIQKMTFLLMAVDVLAIMLAYTAALWIRFDLSFSGIDRKYFLGLKNGIVVHIILSILIYIALGLYRSLWTYVSINEVERTFLASVVSVIAHFIYMGVFVTRMPLSYYVIGWILEFGFITVTRYSYRLLRKVKRIYEQKNDDFQRVMIVGAGEAGRMIMKEIINSEHIGMRVCCIVDDDITKRGKYLNGIKIVGGRHRIKEAVAEYEIEKIIFAIPTIDVESRREILTICSETGCELLQLPGMYQLVNGQLSVSKLKKVQIEDLLGRTPIKADMTDVYKFISGKTVLITGGGGSIGSELSRQVAGHNPKLLIIFDIYENNAYDIQLELKSIYPELSLEVLIGSVRDSRKMFDIFEKYRPQIVYHAAAHKHVPLMEKSPCESIKNNVIGTYKTAYAAMTHGCERFVLISTDKAVNPTNIMGASKRVCEMIIQSFDKKIKQGKASELPQLFTHFDFIEKKRAENQKLLKNAKTEFVAVRFGNVLGSNGSVIPLFKKQIENGGPVTITHPDIIRYFMTIPEAVSLVMLAGTYAKGGEIFVLDMGKPVKIDTLARNLIRLMGLKPDIDIKIEYTGLRPGEKLYEEKLMAEEGLEKTENDLIFIGKPIKFDEDEFVVKLDNLMDQAYKNSENIKELVADVVQTYKIDKKEEKVSQTAQNNEKDKKDGKKVAAIV